MTVYQLRGLDSEWRKPVRELTSCSFSTCHRDVLLLSETEFIVPSVQPPHLLLNVEFRAVCFLLYSNTSLYPLLLAVPSFRVKIVTDNGVTRDMLRQHCAWPLFRNMQACNQSSVAKRLQNLSNGCWRRLKQVIQTQKAEDITSLILRKIIRYSAEHLCSKRAFLDSNGPLEMSLAVNDL
uniref:FBD domain-containing protein n=1 Tax=Setaria digitata TaxID=48799 RepID=A0A915Q2L2_9BILA